jgi:hypothetical protein
LVSTYIITDWSTLPISPRDGVNIREKEDDEVSCKVHMYHFLKEFPVAATLVTVDRVRLTEVSFAFSQPCELEKVK